MSESSEERVLDVRYPTADEESWVATGYDLRRKSADRLDTALTRLVTLSSSLLGGSLVLLKEDVCPAGGRVAAFLAFLACLTFSLWGSRVLTPNHIGGPICSDIPDSVRRGFGEINKIRARWLELAMWALWIGLACASVGTGWKAITDHMAASATAATHAP